ncbi:SUKH-4 family immunity protein [Actinomadura atramentaria]|uniref:SUKH-4 family immunity protein n=1 Tax=Actinomadura atramentaria TaxID=1990 RepID=UPI00035D3F3F|nr:SUKH-4 family immunity protein [Actinomadura atramentaria]
MVPELTFKTLAEEFGADGVLRVADADVPAGVTHGPTRAFLTRVGLPRDLRAMGAADLDDGEPWTTLPELYDDFGAGDWTWEQPDGAEHWYEIAEFYEGGSILLDGATGELWWVADDDRPPARVHSGVDALAYFMYAIRRSTARFTHAYTKALAADQGADDTLAFQLDRYEEEARRLVADLYTADPTPFPDGIGEPWDEDGFAGPWTAILIDVRDGAWS